MVGHSVSSRNEREVEPSACIQPSRPGQLIRIHGIGAPVGIVALGCVWWMLAALLVTAYAQGPDRDSSTAPAHQATAPAATRGHGAQEGEGQPKKYRWLFKERSAEKPAAQAVGATLLDTLDREVRQARKLYLSGDTENSVLKYRNAIDQLESLVDDLPPGHKLLGEVEQWLHIYDEVATKILGPIHLEPKEETAARVFHLMEKRRICRRSLTLKRAGVLEAFGVPTSLLQEEAELLTKLLEGKKEPGAGSGKQTEEALKSKLVEVRRSIQKSSPRYALVRKGQPVPLDEVRRDVLGKDELILDCNFFPDRMVVGVITSEKAAYYQIQTERSEIENGVLSLQELLKELAVGDRSSFMGHAWKEPCRRLYRSLFGQLPALPKDKALIFVVADRALWYLPMPALLDSEDRPFGQDHLVSLIPSVDMLKLQRGEGRRDRQATRTDLVLFESIPWIAQDTGREQTSAGSGKKKAAQQLSEGEKIEHLVVSNPVYPKPTDMVVAVQKLFRKSDVKVGPTVTIESFMSQEDRRAMVEILAVPLAMSDTVDVQRQPAFFFSPDKRTQRRLDARRLFAVPNGSKLVVMPVSWINVRDQEAPLGDGPLLLSAALSFSGVGMWMVNYSDPNWGTEDPFLLGVLKKAADKTPLFKALAEYPREMPAGLDSSFSGQPPAWSGWILVGDPR